MFSEVKDEKIFSNKKHFHPLEKNHFHLRRKESDFLPSVPLARQLAKI